MKVENAYLVTITVSLVAVLTLANDDIEADYDKYNYAYEWDNEAEAIETQSYDFIIVGSGSAGSVLANRLSENPEWNVLLLEAGFREDLLNRMPILAQAWQLTPYNWYYLMEYQDNFAQGLELKRLAWPRGRALGGTTVINYLIYSRGNHRDYDRWEALGNPGWSYEEVLPYFLKSENATLEDANYEYHNTTGPLSIEDGYRSPFVYAYLKAAQELGHRWVDYNSKDQFGFSPIQATMRNGQRHTAARAFLQPVKDRPNLTILPLAYVTKVIIDAKTKTAQGVQYVRLGIPYTAYATKEVILSAGTFNSAQLLILSGVGPKEDLEELDIEVIQDLPVGKKLYDHIAYIGLNFEVNETIDNTPPTLITLSNLIEYLTTGQGPFRSLGGVEGIGFIKTNVSTEKGDFPDMELLFVGLGFTVDLGLVARRTFRIPDSAYYTFWGPYSDKPIFTIFPMLVHPKSIGYMKLRSKNPFAYPRFYGNYFSDEEGSDQATLIEGIRYAIRLATETEAFRAYGAKLSPIPVPGCEDYEFDSNEYWVCAVTHFTITLHHQVATNKMGPENDTEAVVDPQLRVYGIKNLRVADCSVIPLPVAAHTNAPALMVGEKAADLIKSAWNNTS